MKMNVVRVVPVALLAASLILRKKCLFCGQGIVLLGHRAENKLIKVETLSFQKSIGDACESRGDSWSDAVKGRIEYVQGLFAAASVYHDQCNIN